MKIFLDDTRFPPDSSWTLVRSAKKAILLMCEFEVKEISLDHDLGQNLSGGDVLKWIEKQVYTNADFKCPKISIHTQNPVERKKMQAAMESLKRNKWNF